MNLSRSAEPACEFERAIGAPLTIGSLTGNVPRSQFCQKFSGIFKPSGCPLAVLSCRAGALPVEQVIRQRQPKKGKATTFVVPLRCEATQGSTGGVACRFPVGQMFIALLHAENVAA